MGGYSLKRLDDTPVGLHPLWLRSCDSCYVQVSRGRHPFDFSDPTVLLLHYSPHDHPKRDREIEQLLRRVHLLRIHISRSSPSYRLRPSPDTVPNDERVSRCPERERATGAGLERVEIKIMFIPLSSC